MEECPTNAQCIAVLPRLGQGLLQPGFRLRKLVQFNCNETQPDGGVDDDTAGTPGSCKRNTLLQVRTGRCIVGLEQGQRATAQKGVQPGLPHFCSRAGSSQGTFDPASPLAPVSVH